MKHRTIEATWKGMELQFKATKRINRKGECNIVYQVSNYKKPPREHVKIYSFRWNIEKFFRTAKQSLGLNECQIRNKAVQHNCITHVFLAYSLSQLIRKNKKLKNAELAIRSIKAKNYANINFAKSCVEQHFGSLYV